MKRQHVQPAQALVQRHVGQQAGHQRAGRRLGAVGAENTKINNGIVATLGSGQLAALAAADGLVKNTKPDYFSIHQQWPIASQ